MLYICLLHVPGTLIGRIESIEEENFKFKKEICNMEIRLLKAVSDNKSYLVQKVKSFKAILTATYGKFCVYIYKYVMHLDN